MILSLGLNDFVDKPVCKSFVGGHIVVALGVHLELLQRHYPCMKRYMKAVKFWASLSGFGQRKYIWKWLFQFGDWCAPEGYVRDWMAKGKWVATAYYANSCAIMAEIAELLGETKDAAHYAELRRSICGAFRAVLTDGRGTLKKEFQTGYVLSLIHI